MNYKTIHKNEADIEVLGVGKCHASVLILDGGGYQWRIRWRRISVVGDCHVSNNIALKNAINKLTKRLNITK